MKLKEMLVRMGGVEKTRLREEKKGMKERKEEEGKDWEMNRKR